MLPRKELKSQSKRETSWCPAAAKLKATSSLSFSGSLSKWSSNPRVCMRHLFIGNIWSCCHLQEMMHFHCTAIPNPSRTCTDEFFRENKTHDWSRRGMAAHQISSAYAPKPTPPHSMATISVAVWQPPCTNTFHKDAFHSSRMFLSGGVLSLSLSSVCLPRFVPWLLLKLER